MTLKWRVAGSYRVSNPVHLAAIKSSSFNGHQWVERVNQPDPSTEKSEIVDWRNVLIDRDLFPIT